jgi:hypothetical protein
METSAHLLMSKIEHEAEKAEKFVQKQKEDITKI